jgi:acetate---CoA ligase (ADP-forming)
MSGLELLFKPRSVAVIGASADANKTAGRPIAFLQKQGFTGAIYPVNPRVSQINGLSCYASIADLPTIPDVAMVLLGAERAQDAVRQLAALGVPFCIILASGYAETGEAGAVRQAMLLEAAGEMRLLGPNTIGLVNLTDGIVLSPSGAMDMAYFERGSIGVVSQSGGILGAILSRASARGVGISKLVATSNEVDIDLADCVDYLVDDPATDVIVLYIETVRHPVRFKASCSKARAANGGIGKPIVAFKIGRSQAGAAAAVSHTGAMAGSDRMYDALFAACGVIRAQTFSDLLDMPLALSTLAVGKKLMGKRVAILTSTGGAGTLVSDSLGLAGFEAPAPDAETAAKLRATQSGDHAVFDKNPIDVTLAGLQPAVLRGAVAALLASSSYDALIVIVGSSGVAQPNLMADAIAGALTDEPAYAHKPVLAYVSPHAPEAAAVLSSLGVPAFTAPESCASALLAMAHQQALGKTQQENWEAKAQTIRAESPPVFPPVLASFSGSLDEFEAKRVFAFYSIPVPRECVVTSNNDALEATSRMVLHGVNRFVLKILSNTITHKSDVGGVAVNLLPEQVSDRLNQMRPLVEANTGMTCEQFLLQEMVDISQGGVEMILGMSRDPLGAGILVGMGGTAAELLEDTALRLCPVNHAEALAMLQSLKTWPLLNGYRGRPLADVNALVDAIVAFSNMVEQLGDRLVTAEINPLFVLQTGKGVVAADAVMVLAK